MKFNFENLDKETRQIMLDEIKQDISNKRLYFSNYFNSSGEQLYPDLLQESAKNGDEQTLAAILKTRGCFKAQTERKTKSGVSLVKVPETANETVAQGEFNRFYIRSLCVRAIAAGKQLEIYRARQSENPRPESEMAIGENIDASKLLSDLRSNIGVETAFGIPGINSGLTVKLV